MAEKQNRKDVLRDKMDSEKRMSIEDKMREQLDKTLEVYYTKNVETNKEREEDKKKAIDWIINTIMQGPVKGGIQGSSYNNPDYSWTFGDSYIWEGEKKCILIRDPICRICGKKPSVEVHHIRPKHLKGNPVHPGNLIGLCLECHDEVHRRIDKGIQKAIDDSLDIEFTAPKQKTLEGYDD